MKQAATFLVPLIIIIPGLAYTLAESKHTEPKPTTTPLPAIQVVAETQAPQEISEAPGSIPANSLYQLLAAELALDRQQPELAMANYIAAAQETQDPRIAARATQIALSTAGLEDAIVPAMIWAKTAPNDLEAQITTAAIYIRLNEPDKAVPYLNQAQSKNTEEAFQYFLVLFKQLQEAKDNENVVSALEKLSQIKSKSIAGLLALSEIYLMQNQADKALKLIDDALSKEPDSALAIQLKSETLLRTQNKEASKAFLDKIMPSNDNFLLKQYYAQFLYENGYQDLARQQMSLLTTNTKILPEDQIQFARLAMQAKWYDLAEKFLNNSAKNKETQNLSHYFLGRLFEEQNDIPKAITSYEKVSEGPFHVLSQLRASVLLADRKDYDRALKILNNTQPSDDVQQKQLVLTKVEILNQAQNYKESLDLLNDEIKVAPEEIDLRYARSIVADKLNESEIAETDLKKILSIKPNHVDALNALGFMLANKTKRFNEAQNYLNTAIKLEPNNPQVLDSLGWLNYKQGNYEKAYEYLKKASDLSADAEIAAHLGEVMWKMRDYEGAKRVWNNALERFPQHENVLNAMDRMMSRNK